MRTPKMHTAKDGTRSWTVRYRAGQTQKSETFYDYDEAVEWAKLLNAWGVARALAWLDDKDRLEGKSALTLDELFERWHTWRSATRPDGSLKWVRSTRTLEDDERDYRRRISPWRGTTPVDMISPSDVQDWIDQLPLEPKTVSKYHALLHQMLAWGAEPARGLVAADPCATTKLPIRRKKPPKGLRADEWRILHQAAQDVDDAAADLLLGLVATSWRWSEIARVPVFAVDHWIEEHVDEKGRRTEESFTYLSMGRVLRREAGNRYVIVEDAKSEAGDGRRTRLKGSAEAMVLRRIEGKGIDDLIFTTKTGAPWSYNRFHQRVWTRPANPKHDPAPKKTRILERAVELGLRRPITGKGAVTPHWLRHTGIGFLILAGEPVTAISRHAGHGSIKTTIDVYGRAIDGVSSIGLDKMAALIDGPAPKGLPSAS